MNIAALKENFLQIKEIKPIGRTLDMDGVVCHVMGFVLQPDGTLKLLILEYDGEYRDKAEQGISGANEKPSANRAEQRGDNRIEPRWRFFGAERVRLGGETFNVNGCGSEVCSARQWNMAVLFTRFLACGWDPSGIDTQGVDYMYLTSLSIDGTYSSMPDFEVSAPVRFSMRPASRRELAEMPLTLTVGGDYDEKLYFGGEKARHWLQINRVCLYDVWDEFEKMFDDPHIKNLVTEEDPERRKAEVAAALREKCPEGMCFAAIEYECEEGLSVQFYSKRWLDGEPVRKAQVFSALLINKKPDRPVGKLGTELKTSVIQEPFPPDTDVIEAELFCYHTRIEGYDAVI